MSDFNSVLTRAFAEAPQPADDTFVVNVAQGVVRHERVAKLIGAAQVAGAVIGGCAVAYGAWSVLSGFAPDLMSWAGLQATRVNGALSEAPVVAQYATSAGSTWLNSLGVGLTTVLFGVGALAGGAVAIRNAQQQ